MNQKLLRNTTMKVAELLQKVIAELAGLHKGILTAEVILMELIEQKDSIVLKVLEELQFDVQEKRRAITDQVVEHIAQIPTLQGGAAGSMKVALEAQLLFEAAEEERRKLEDSYISTMSLFLACFSSRVGPVKDLLEGQGISYDQAFSAVKTIRGNKKVTEKDDESRARTLEEYTVDITALARKGALDPVIGRDDTIKRVIEILSRRKKNNPILIGEPGVGKTVIVEGLAQKIVEAEVPDYLLNRRVVSLEMGTLVAGAKMQGEFEERLKAIVDEVIAAAGDIVLFIDEIHTVVGAGRSGGSLDASNMLKPALARGLLQCIGATTLREYKQHIESDKALERRFQLVRVSEPTVEQAIQILRGIRPKYQNHHQIEYTDAAIEKAVTLSDRYIQQRYLPDKAIDLMDEAGARKRMKLIYTPQELRELEAKRQQLASLRESAFAESNFEKMARHQMNLAVIEKELNAKKNEHHKSYTEEDKRVTDEDIAEVVSQITGIPAQKMVTAEVDKLRNLETAFQSRVIGQDHAAAIVANAIRRNRSGLRRMDRPIASFLFLGPTGVGKTEMAKTIAEQVLDDESKIIRIDMSEYMERHAVSRLIGSPPGYVGYGEGGQLTEKVKHQPYAVVLFDEFEKAHPDVYNILLQVLDEGWLTDGEGNRVSFRNCILIGTSNIGSQALVDRKKPVGLTVGNDSSDEADDRKTAIMKEVRSFLRPEFINRLDEIIVFNQLSIADLEKILGLQIADLEKRMAEIGKKLEFSPKAKDFLLKNIESLNYGARPLKRKLEEMVENPVASLVLEKPDSDTIQVVCRKGKISVTC